MSGRRRTRAAGILILCGAVLLEPTGACLAEAVTMRDLADVLPAASAFARKTRPFPYLVGYATDGGRAVGVVFLTTEVVPEQCWGYRDQIATLVGVDSAGQITGIKVLSESENARYTKGLLADGSWFLAQFTGKDAGDRFVLYSDVEGITGATITSSTLTRSVKAGLELITDQILRRHVDGAHPAARFPSQELLWQADCVFLWAIVGSAMWSFFKVNQWLRYFVLGLSFAYLGIIMGGGASTNDVLRSLSGHSPVLESDLYWYSLVIIALALIPIAGRFYCGWLCPFGALTDVSFLLVPSQWEIPGNVHRYLRFAKYAILGIVLLLGLLPGASTAAVYAVGVVEPFATLFKLQWDLLSWVFLIPILLFSLFVPRFYCRYFCPLGAFFALLAGASSLLGLRLMRPSLPEDSCKGCRLAQKECRMNAISYDASSRRPDVDRSECLMCNRCAAVCPVGSKRF